VFRGPQPRFTFSRPKRRCNPSGLSVGMAWESSEVIKGLSSSIGNPNSPVKVKLMALDFVLAHRQHHYLAIGAEKLDHFAGTLGLNHSYLPQRIYRSRHGRNITTRYFVDKLPLFLPARLARHRLWSGFVMWTAA
jgi:hypothetical protein